MDPTQLLKGVVDAAVLAVLLDADCYGYDVIRRLRSAGFDGLGDATVYGTLRRLHNAGRVRAYLQPSDEGPARKYYAINDEGRVAVQEAAVAWRRFRATVDTVLETA
jgi:PadR family transcriptional regulator PadR